MVCSSADDKCLVVDLFLNQKFIETDKDYKLSDIPLTMDIKKTSEDAHASGNIRRWEDEFYRRN